MQKPVVTRKENIRPDFHGCRQGQGILPGDILLCTEFLCPVQNGIDRPLSCRAKRGKPERLGLAIGKRTNNGFVLVNERPYQSQLLRLRPVENFLTGQCFNLDADIRRIVEWTLKAIIVGINQIHVVGDLSFSDGMTISNQVPGAGRRGGFTAKAGAPRTFSQHRQGWARVMKPASGFEVEWMVSPG